MSSLCSVCPLYMGARASVAWETMKRSFAPVNLVALPRLDANSAAVLARSLESAAANAKKEALLGEAIEAALHDVHKDREALQQVLGTPATKVDIQSADRAEDAAVGALNDLLAAWARLAGHTVEGDLASTLRERLFDGGVGFINWESKEEWGVVETKLQTIAREGLDSELDKLGAGPMLAFLQKTHKHYGEVLGTTRAVKVVDTPAVREHFEALLDSLRVYVLAVSGSVQRRRPETQERADALLLPLRGWVSKGTRAAESGLGAEDGGAGEGVRGDAGDESDGGKAGMSGGGEVGNGKKGGAGEPSA